jgi:hypothetical protein
MQLLTAVRGLGVWSVEMFMCFGLKRTDVFSTGDLGVQRGCAAYVGRDTKKLRTKPGKWKYMSEADMLATAEPFRPYRSVFMWYMWRIEDVVSYAALLSPAYAPAANLKVFRLPLELIVREVFADTIAHNRMSKWLLDLETSILRVDVVTHSHATSIAIQAFAIRGCEE